MFRKYKKGEKNMKCNHQPVFHSRDFKLGWSHADPSPIGNFGFCDEGTNRLLFKGKKGRVSKVRCQNWFCEW